MFTAAYFFWTLVYNLPAVGMLVAGSMLAWRRGLPRAVRAVRSILIGLAGAWTGIYAACEVIRRWYSWQPGVTQGDWLPALDALSFALGIVEASAVIAITVAVLAGRSPIFDEDES